MARVAQYSAWRSRWMTCVDAGAAASPRSRQTSSSSSGSTWAKLPTAPEILPTAITARARRRRSRLRPASAYHTATLRPKVMGSACTPWVRPIITVSLWRTGEGAQHAAQALLSGDEQVGGVAQLQRGRGVPHVGGGQAHVDEARVLAEMLLQVREEGDHLVLHAGQDLLDARDVDPGPGPDARHGLRRDAPAPRVGLAHRQLHAEPGRVLGLLAPDAAHGRDACTARSSASP